MTKNASNESRNIVDTSYPYNGNILDLRVDYVKFPSGDVKIREIVEHKPAVAIFIVNQDGKICLVSQYRHAVDTDVLEIPAGLVEDGETPYDAAIRELQEETGYKALNMTKVSDFYTSPGFSTEMIHLYYTSDFIISKLPEENEEHITALWFTVEEIESEIMAGNIKDGKTILAYYWYCVKRINHATI
ncbi:MAG: NUDIX hydrolase [Synergistaceae bacterium]|nr:NUDIX hydrolase [Synergistaceae bacterium]